MVQSIELHIGCVGDTEKVFFSFLYLLADDQQATNL